MRNIIVVKVVPKIAQGVNTLCHRVNMGDGGSGAWAPDKTKNLEVKVSNQFVQFIPHLM